jgi:hypothetical protein
MTLFYLTNPGIFGYNIPVFKFFLALCYIIFAYLVITLAYGLLHAHDPEVGGLRHTVDQLIACILGIAALHSPLLNRRD